MSPAEVLKIIKEKGVKFVDLRFTDTRGKEQHVTVPAHVVDAGMFEDGKMFDGSSIAGWKGINESDMILGLDPSTAVLDPFMEETTLNIRCDIIEPIDDAGLRARSALGRETRRSLHALDGHRRRSILRPRKRVLHLRRRPLVVADQRRFLCDRVVRRRVAEQQEDRRRQPRSPSRHQGRLLPRAARRLAAGYSLGDVLGARGNGPIGRSAPPRGGNGRSMRDRRQIRLAREEGRRRHDAEIRRAERRAQLW